MKKNRAMCLVPLAVCIVGIFGCASPTPVAQNFPLTYQKVARTAQHWDIVADDVVNTTIQAINSNPVLQHRPLFVSRNVDASAFDASFRDFLITNMVQRNMEVNVCHSDSLQKSGFMDANPVQVEYEARVIYHRAGVSNYLPGGAVMLGAGVEVLRNIAESDLSNHSTIASTLGVTAAIDVARSYITRATNTELILTTTIAENNRFVMRRSDVYYLPDKDINLFIDSVAQRTTCQDEVRALSDAAKARIDAAAKAKGIARDEASRLSLFVAAMRRSNPQWGR